MLAWTRRRIADVGTDPSVIALLDSELLEIAFAFVLESLALHDAVDI
jgi:hypothetical protein